MNKEEEKVESVCWLHPYSQAAAPSNLNHSSIHSLYTYLLKFKQDMPHATLLQHYDSLNTSNYKEFKFFLFQNLRIQDYDSFNLPLDSSVERKESLRKLKGKKKNKFLPSVTLFFLLVNLT